MSDEAPAPLNMIRVQGGPTSPALRPVVNGVVKPIPFNTDVEIDAPTFDALRSSDVYFEIVSRRDVVAEAGETSDGAVSGGTGGTVATINPPEPPIDPPAPPVPDEAEAARAKLLAMLDLSVPKLTAGLEGMSRDDLHTLLVAERAGKTRNTAIAAIEAAIAAVDAA